MQESMAHSNENDKGYVSITYHKYVTDQCSCEVSLFVLSQDKGRIFT